MHKKRLATAGELTLQRFHRQPSWIRGPIRDRKGSEGKDKGEKMDYPPLSAIPGSATANGWLLVQQTVGLVTGQVENVSPHTSDFVGL